ncbi:MAG: hybrid sensor histidine kinase/response regulator [Fidelibacterota bacterium]|nr:MAG: hybrid sensor histidine kinase/response regulator [Candidatus Neomarinimicrobiota bacterium]
MSAELNTAVQLGILLVVAEPDERTHLEKLLNSAGHEVRTTASGAQAFELLAREQFHLALIDLALPDMKGLDVSQRAKQDWPELVTVLLSASPLEPQEEVIRHQADELMLKPVSANQLAFLTEKYGKYIQALLLARELQERLEVAEEKSNLFYEAGHQLKTPIAVLKEFAHLFRDAFGGEMSEKQSLYLEAIDQNIDRLLYLVDNIEQMSRLDRGSWSIRLEDSDLREIISQVASSWRPILQGHSLQLAEVLGADLPKVRTDAAALEQVLFNLVDNAVKYGPAESTVTLRCYQSNDRQVRIEVEDQGSDISEEQRELLFKPFARLQEHASAPGLGLGLSIARDLMERMGGELWLDTADKPGNRFCLHIPIAEPAT